MKHRNSFIASMLSIAGKTMNKESARKISEFVNLAKFDSIGRVAVAIVPGHNAQYYHVSFNRSKINSDLTPTIRCTCRNPDLGEDCKGNRHGVCYHAVGALIASANKKGLTVSLCDDAGAAKSLAAMGGTVIRLLSMQSGKSIFLVQR